MTTHENTYGADLKKLNHDVLVLFREMVRRDKTEACLILGLENEAAEAIGQATLDEIRKISSTGVFLYRPRFYKTRFWTDILQAAREGDEEELDAARFHAIVYASEEST